MEAYKAKQLFIETYYGGDKKAYLKARRADYCKVQFEWACFMGGLCKDGVISEKVWNNATF